MYEYRLSHRDRVAILAGVILAQGALLFALINMSANVREALPDDVVEMFDVTQTPPPPPDPPVVAQKEAKAKPKEAEGAASARNVKSQATEIKDPKPEVKLPPQPTKVSDTPKQGTDATQGASNVAGSGTGSGGVGNGTGSGGAGNGTGGGGAGGMGVRLIRGVVSRDYPDAIIKRWPRDGRIFVRLRVQPDGSISQCDVMRSYGDALADQWTCSLLRQRGQFRPATDASGRPIAAWFGYIQAPTGQMYNR